MNSNSLSRSLVGSSEPTSSQLNDVSSTSRSKKRKTDKNKVRLKRHHRQPYLYSDAQIFDYFIDREEKAKTKKKNKQIEKEQKVELNRLFNKHYDARILSEYDKYQTINRKIKQDPDNLNWLYSCFDETTKQHLQLYIDRLRNGITRTFNPQQYLFNLYRTHSTTFNTSSILKDTNISKFKQLIDTNYDENVKISQELKTQVHDIRQLQEPTQLDTIKDLIDVQKLNLTHIKLVDVLTQKEIQLQNAQNGTEQEMLFNEYKELAIFLITVQIKRSKIKELEDILKNHFLVRLLNSAQVLGPNRHDDLIQTIKERIDDCMTTPDKATFLENIREYIDETLLNVSKVRQHLDQNNTRQLKRAQQLYRLLDQSKIDFQQIKTNIYMYISVNITKLKQYKQDGLLEDVQKTIKLDMNGNRIDTTITDDEFLTTLQTQLGPILIKITKQRNLHEHVSALLNILLYKRIDAFLHEHVLTVMYELKQLQQFIHQNMRRVPIHTNTGSFITYLQQEKERRLSPTLRTYKDRALQYNTMTSTDRRYYDTSIQSYVYARQFILTLNTIKSQITTLVGDVRTHEDTLKTEHKAFQRKAKSIARLILNDTMINDKDLLKVSNRIDKNTSTPYVTIKHFVTLLKRTEYDDDYTPIDTYTQHIDSIYNTTETVLLQLDELLKSINATKKHLEKQIEQESLSTQRTLRSITKSTKFQQLYQLVDEFEAQREYNPTLVESFKENLTNILTVITINQKKDVLDAGIKKTIYGNRCAPLTLNLEHVKYTQTNIEFPTKKYHEDVDKEFQNVFSLSTYVNIDYYKNIMNQKYDPEFKNLYWKTWLRKTAAEDQAKRYTDFKTYVQSLLLDMRNKPEMALQAQTLQDYLDNKLDVFNAEGYLSSLYKQKQYGVYWLVGKNRKFYTENECLQYVATLHESVRPRAQLIQECNTYKRPNRTVLFWVFENEDKTERQEFARFVDYIKYMKHDIENRTSSTEERRKHVTALQFFLDSKQEYPFEPTVTRYKPVTFFITPNSKRNTKLIRVGLSLEKQQYMYRFLKKDSMIPYLKISNVGFNVLKEGGGGDYITNYDNDDDDDMIGEQGDDTDPVESEDDDQEEEAGTRDSNADEEEDDTIILGEKEDLVYTRQHKHRQNNMQETCTEMIWQCLLCHQNNKVLSFERFTHKQRLERTRYFTVYKHPRITFFVPVMYVYNPQYDFYLPAYFESETYIPDIRTQLDGIQDAQYVLLKNPNNAHAHVRSRYYIDVPVRVQITGQTTIHMHREGVLKTKMTVRPFINRFGLPCDKHQYRSLTEIFTKVSSVPLLQAINTYLCCVLKNTSNDFYLHLEFVAEQMNRFVYRQKCPFTETVHKNSVMDIIDTKAKSTTLLQHVDKTVLSNSLKILTDPKYLLELINTTHEENILFPKKQADTLFVQDDALKAFQNSFRTLYEKEMKPYIISFQQYLLNENLEAEHVDKTIKHFEHVLKKFDRSTGNLSTFFKTFKNATIDRDPTLKEVTNVLIDYKKRFEQLQNPLVVRLRQDVQNNLINFFVLYPKFQRLNDWGEFTKEITQDDLLKTYALLSLEDQKSKIHDGVLVLDLHIFIETMTRLWETENVNNIDWKEHRIQEKQQMLQLLQEARKKQNLRLHYDKTRREKDNDEITYKHQYVTYNQLPSMYFD